MTKKDFVELCVREGRKVGLSAREMETFGDLVFEPVLEQDDIRQLIGASQAAYQRGRRMLQFCDKLDELLRKSDPKMWGKK